MKAVDVLDAQISQGEFAEMNAAKMRGAMLTREDVERAMFEIWRDVRDRQSAAPAVHASAPAKGGS